MRSSHRRALALVATLAVIGAACGDDEEESTSTEAETETTEAATATTAAEEETTETTAAATETTAAAEEGATETTEYVAPERGDADLVIWADDTRTPVLTPIAEAFSEAEGVTVVVQEVPFNEIRGQLTLTGPAGEGPDIIIGAHDWLGELVSNGVVAPIDLGPAADAYADVAIEAFTYEGRQYGLPYAVENIALLRNTDLVPEAPATFEELVEIGQGLVADGTVEMPLVVEQANGAAPYHNYPMFTGPGGYVFGQNEDGSYNPDDLGIDSEGGLAAAELFGQWYADGVLNIDVDNGVMNEMFTSGKTPFAITGPWAEAFNTEGLNFTVEPVPSVAGGTPQVFVGVQGFMISAFSEVPELATSFLLDYLNTEEVQLALFDAGGRPPAMTSAFEQVSTDPYVQGFGLSGQQGAPLPAIPEMGAVWGAWQDAYVLIAGGADPVQAFTDAAASIRADIGG